MESGLDKRVVPKKAWSLVARMRLTGSGLGRAFAGLGIPALRSLARGRRRVGLGDLRGGLRGLQASPGMQLGRSAA